MVSGLGFRDCKALATAVGGGGFLAAQLFVFLGGFGKLGYIFAGPC